jgi:hypothetical protein
MFRIGVQLICDIIIIEISIHICFEVELILIRVDIRGLLLQIIYLHGLLVKNDSHYCDDDYDDNNDFILMQRMVFD